MVERQAGGKSQLKEGVFSYESYYNKVPWAGQLKKQNVIISLFWRLEVLDQGITGIGFL